ncbi:MAG: prepilin-type N-terminal cleavage/methylation domain-containing protein [Elusimicrobia bacterium]|nr:prepilin-type N-terminal cleavage/methylation domain-containing protein [Elusimicrobiota bacterium]
MKKTKGFTLVELIIVIVIVGILSIVAVPVYKGYTKKAMGTEGKSLLGSIATAERVYFAEYNYYCENKDSNGTTITDGVTSYNKVLDIDARNNKYFKSFKIDTDSSKTDDKASFTATVTGAAGTGAENIKLVLTNPSSGTPVITEDYEVENNAY